MAIEAIKKTYPINDENGNPSTYPTMASQVFFDDGTVLEGKEFGGGGGSVDPLTIYPVGSIYMSVNSTSPASLFGGTWEQIKGRFLLGTGTPEANSDGTSPGSYDYGLNIKGGEEKHKLIVNEIASHTHVQQFYAKTLNNNAGTYAGAVYDTNVFGTTTGITFAENEKTLGAGGDQPHNNMPPYLAVNMWQRIG